MGKSKEEILKGLAQLLSDDSEGEENAEGSGEEASTVETKLDATKIADDIANKIVKAITDAKGGNSDDRQELKNKFFNPQGGFQAIEFPEMNKLKSLSKEDKIVVWFKAMTMRHQDPQADQVFKALVEGSDPDGGYTVPEEFRSEVFRILPDFAIMRRLARVIPMNTDTLNLETLTARPQAYWTEEYQSISTTSAEFGQVVLSPHKLVCLLPSSRELLADSNINMVQFIIQLFAEAIGLAEDKAFFRGTGTGQPKGIATETISSRSAGGATTMDHIIDLIDMVPTSVSRSPKAAFVGNRYVKRILRKVKDTSGAYIWRDGGSAQSSNGETVRLPDTLYGYRFEEQNDLAQSELYFGDWSSYIIGDRESMSVETTNVGGDAWRRHSTEVKAVERVDGKTVLTGAFAKLTSVG